MPQRKDMQGHPQLAKVLDEMAAEDTDSRSTPPQNVTGDKCAVCRHAIQTQAFKGTGFCCTNCRKDYEREYNELHPHPTQYTEFERRLLAMLQVILECRDQLEGTYGQATIQNARISSAMRVPRITIAESGSRTLLAVKRSSSD